MRIPSHLSLFVTVAYVLRRRWSSPGFERLDIEAAAPASSLPPFFPFLFPPPLPAAPFFTGFFPAKRSGNRETASVVRPTGSIQLGVKNVIGGKRKKKKKKRKERKGKKRTWRGISAFRPFLIPRSLPPSILPLELSVREFFQRSKRKRKRKKKRIISERERERRLASSREFVEVSRNGEIEGRR